MEWYTLIKPLGIIVYSLLAINVLAGLFMKKIRLKSKFRIHTVIGILALLAATIHFLLVFIYS